MLNPRGVLAATCDNALRPMDCGIFACKRYEHELCSQLPGQPLFLPFDVLETVEWGSQPAAACARRCRKCRKCRKCHEQVPKDASSNMPHASHFLVDPTCAANGRKLTVHVRVMLLFDSAGRNRTRQTSNTDSDVPSKHSSSSMSCHALRSRLAKV